MHSSQSAQYRCTVERLTCKVNGKERNLTPNDIKIPDFFSSLNMSSMITSQSSTPVQMFISINSVWASPQISEILRFCDFSWLVTWLYCNFCRARAEVEPAHGFSRFMAHTALFSPNDGPFGDATIA